MNSADCVMTDKWISMGDEVNKKKIKKLLKHYQVNKKIMKLSKQKLLSLSTSFIPTGTNK